MRRQMRLAGVWIGLFAVALGCGQAADMRSASGPYYSENGGGSDNAGAAGADIDLTPTAESLPSAGETVTPTADEPKLQRKIIYNATLDIVVESFADVVASVEKLVREYDGFIASSSIDTASGRPRSGSWTIRVPVARYGAFLEASGGLGELQRRVEDSREVTAEYYDVETRIRNKRLEEERLLQHLQESTGKLEDILAVEKEIARVRTELERLEGRLRVLTDLTALSTITLNISEIQAYVPVESPTFGTQIRRAWQQSLQNLAAAGRTVVIGVVAIVPWLVVIAPMLFIVAVLWRRRRRTRR